MDESRLLRQEGSWWGQHGQLALTLLIAVVAGATAAALTFPRWTAPLIGIAMLAVVLLLSREKSKVMERKAQTPSAASEGHSERRA